MEKLVLVLRKNRWDLELGSPPLWLKEDVGPFPSLSPSAPRHCLGSLEDNRNDNDCHLLSTQYVQSILLMYCLPHFFGTEMIMLPT